MRVLGVDPGLSRCGVGVVEGRAGRARPRRAGVIRTSPDQPVGRRLSRLFAELNALIADECPDVVAVERVFFGANVSTAIGVAQAAGIAQLCAANAGVDVVEYTPSRVKAVITGDGAAEKSQVGYMIAAQLGLDAVPRPADATDALAVALCHLQQPGDHGAAAMSPRLAAAVAAAGPGAQVARPARVGGGA